MQGSSYFRTWLRFQRSTSLVRGRFPCPAEPGSAIFLLRAPISGGGYGRHPHRSTPAIGHVAPLTTIGSYLVARGHRVRMITGSRFAETVGHAGIEHVPLRGAADIDDRDLDAALLDRSSKRGSVKLRYDIDSFFIGRCCRSRRW